MYTYFVHYQNVVFWLFSGLPQPIQTQQVGIQLTWIKVPLQHLSVTLTPMAYIQLCEFTTFFSVSQFCACKEFLVTPAVWSPLCRKLVWVASIYFLWQGWLYVGCRWRLWPRWHHGRSEACRRASPAACREPVEWPAVVTFDRLTRNKTKWALPSNLPYSHRHGLIPLVSLIFFSDCYNVKCS